MSEAQEAARTLGRLGGLKGGKARAAKLTPERRKEIAQKAVAARWAKSVQALRAVDVEGENRPIWSGEGFFSTKAIDQLIAEQGTAPVSDLSILAGAIPDEDLDEFVADIYRSRKA
jgi:hypothetical protein